MPVPPLFASRALYYKSRVHVVVVVAVKVQSPELPKLVPPTPPAPPWASPKPSPNPPNLNPDAGGWVTRLGQA